MTVALKLNSFTKSKSNQSLGWDDYFFALLISLPSIYPALTHKPMSAINASIENSIISNISPFCNYGTIYHLCKLGLYSQIGEQPSYPYSSTSFLLYQQYHIMSIIYMVFNDIIFTKYGSLQKINHEFY